MSHFLTWSTSSSLWSSNLNDLNSLLMSYTYQTSRDKDSGTKVLTCNKSWLKPPLRFRCSRVVLTTRPRSLWSQQRLWVLLHDRSFEGTSCHMCHMRTHSTGMLLKDRDVFFCLGNYKSLGTKHRSGKCWSTLGWWQVLSQLEEDLATPGWSSRLICSCTF